LIAAIAATALIAGCGGPLNIDLIVGNEVQSATYRVEDSGVLSVSTGGGMTEATAKQLRRVELGKDEMGKLRKVVASSGILLADAPGKTIFAGPGPVIVAEVSLGLMRNRIVARTGEVESLTKLCQALNEHLPAWLKIPTSPTGKLVDPFKLQE
jgi:hypothetical protein